MTFNLHSSKKIILKKSTFGFTLIEIVIAMAIMVFISYGIYRATVETFRLREGLSAESEFYHTVRIAMAIMQRDIALLYSPLMMLPPDSTSAPTKTEGNPSSPQTPPSQRPSLGTPTSTIREKSLEEILTSELGRVTEFWMPAIHKSGIRPSRFVGTDKKITMITTSHLRIYKDLPESDFAKVTFEILSDSDKNSLPGTYVLWRLENTNAFEDDEKKEKESTTKLLLLRGIAKYQFEYFRKNKETGNLVSEKSWDTDHSDFRNQYPIEIRLSVSTKGIPELTFDGVYSFRPEVPLKVYDSTI